MHVQYAAGSLQPLLLLDAAAKQQVQLAGRVPDMRKTSRQLRCCVVWIC